MIFTREELFIKSLADNSPVEVPEPWTRKELLMAAINDKEIVPPAPRTRLECFLASLGGTYTGALPDPETREEMYWAALAGSYTGALPQPVTAGEGVLYEMCARSEATQ
ncbi:MAG: hypothetical protein LUG62_08835 [Clostridiales bacterium]|nr:hypothetical protein [Clostridiales bacterium]